MSSTAEKTAEMFKDKSEEEIINWMVTNMTPEQIKSCFEDEVPSGPSGPPTLNDLRKYCENKRYVIHKIEGEGVDAKVYFWYYLTKSEKWTYSVEQLSNFPTAMGQNAEECGNDTNVKSDFADKLKSSYEQANTYEGELFNEYNEGEDETNVFNQVKSEYKTEGINKAWQVEEVTNILLTAIEIQKRVPIPEEYKDIFSFAPILIEATTKTKVYYYYLVNEGGDPKFQYVNGLSIDKFEDDVKEIVDDLKLGIEGPEGREEGKRRVDEWVEVIKQATVEDASEDLNTIKEIYEEFPLSPASPFFMKGLFNNNSFGKSVDLNKVDLSKYVMNKFGTNTAKLFTAKVVSNKFGTNTIVLVRK
jgi:hypothetical protein